MSDSLRILYISHSHPPDDEPLKNLGGMQRVSMQLCEKLNRRSDVVLETMILKTPWKGIAVRTAGFLAKLILRLPGRVRRFKADVVLFSSMVTASTVLAAGWRLGVPAVVITHGQDVTLPNPLYQWLVPKIFDRIDGVIAVSKATRKACIERGMNPDYTRALANGFDMENEQVYPEYTEAKSRLTRKLNLNLDGRYLLLTVGRLVKRKGHERFIRNVLPSVSQSVIYLIIGDGPREEAIQRAIQQTGQADKVYLAGRQPDAVLQDAYAVSDLFVMPNVPVEGDMEGFGIVLLEANMAATPAVASDLEGIKDVIENGQNGFRIEVDNDQAFALKIEELLTQHDLSQFGERAKQYVKSQFSWERVAGRYVDFLREIVRERKNQ